MMTLDLTVATTACVRLPIETDPGVWKCEGDRDEDCFRFGGDTSGGVPEVIVIDAPVSQTEIVVVEQPGRATPRGVIGGPPPYVVAMTAPPALGVLVTVDAARRWRPGSVNDTTDPCPKSARRPTPAARGAPTPSR